MGTLLVLVVSPALRGAPLPEPMELFSAGDSVERALSPGESHWFAITLADRQYARLVVDQRGRDVAVSVTGPDGTPRIEVDGPTGRFGKETVSLLSAAHGTFLVEIRALDRVPESGTYRLDLAELRPAVPEDETRIAVERMMAEGYRLLQAGAATDLQAALPLTEEALSTARELGDGKVMAALRYRLGLVLFRLGQAKPALGQLEQALAFQRESGDGLEAMLTLNLLGRVHRALADSTKALDAFEEALRWNESVGHPELAAPVLTSLGVLHHEAGHWREALENYTRALAIFRQAGDFRSQANVSSSLGSLYSTLGQPTAALEHLREAVELARRAKRKDIEANALNNLGDLYSSAGRPRLALESFWTALGLFHELGDASREAAALNNIGSLLIDLGASQEGGDLLLEALSRQKEPRIAARIKTNLARVERSLGETAKARRWIDEARTFFRESQDQPGEAQSLYLLGLLELGSARPSEGGEHFLEALKLFRKTGDRFWQGVTLRALGQSQAALHAPEAALDFLAEALAIFQSVEDPAEQARVFQVRARVNRDRGDFEAARRDLSTAVDLFESLRADLSSERLRTTFLGSIRDVYGEYIDILTQLHQTHSGAGYDSRAFTVAERSRARGLLDFLARSDIEVRHGDPAQVAEAVRLREELAARSNRRLDLLRDESKAEEAAALEREIETLITDYRLLEARLRAGDPRYAALRDPAIDLAAVQKLLDQETVLLEYSLGETRSWLWIVTPESLETQELPGRAQIEELAVRVHQHLRSPNPTGVGDERADLAELSRVLLGPALDRIEGKRLAIVADGALHYVPFAALPVPAPDGGAVPLVVRHEVVHLPSAAVLREIRRADAARPRPTADLAIPADPVYESTDPRVHTAANTAAKKPAGAAAAPQAAEVSPAGGILRSLDGATRAGSLARLPWSRREAEKIAAAAAGREVRLALGVDASRDLALSSELARYKILHFATHGVLDADNPELSGLALSLWDEQGQQRDGFLRLQDVYGLELHADLVVLSGCETALGKRVRGEGLLGLTHGFLHAGATAVVASLWGVRDQATAELMARFYRALYHDGRRPAAALRAAQVTLWQERTWRDPYYWAAFMVQGDW